MSLLGVTDLTLRYGKDIVLSDVSFPAFHPGSMVGVLGPNGVGKSTLLRALAGMQPYDGEIRLMNEPLSAVSHLRRTGLIGYLPQTPPQGTSLVAYEAVISACRAVRPDLSKRAVEAAAEETFERLGIAPLAFRALSKMSGGQRQMVGLAQILVRKPAVLLLDEPTSALDLRWQLAVFQIIRDTLAEQGGLCLMALHDINLALRHCDSIALLCDGGVLSYGPPKEAMTAENLRRAYRVEGRVETCSNGTPIVITDGVLAGGSGELR